MLKKILVNIRNLCLIFVGIFLLGVGSICLINFGSENLTQTIVKADETTEVEFTGSGTQYDPFIVTVGTDWETVINRESSEENKTYVKLGSDITAVSDTRYRTTFGSTGVVYALTTGAYYYGAINVPNGKYIDLDLAGYTIDRKLTSSYGNGNCIRVYGSLILKDSSESSSGKITGGYASSGGGVYVGSNAIFKMNGGTISGNKVSISFAQASSSKTDTASGGGVYVEGMFKMTGGLITDNVATATIRSDATTNGSATSVGNSFGGGVYVNGIGSFEMSGGTISRNIVSTFSTAYAAIKRSVRANSTGNSSGGGVYTDGSFKMTGGTIRGNAANSTTKAFTDSTGGNYSKGYANSFGGGVYVNDNGIFEMSGGSIINNGNTTTANSESTTYSKNQAEGYANSYAGGVYVAGTFVMMKGNIAGNNISATSNYINTFSNSYAGGIYIKGTFTMLDGTILNNDATANAVATNANSYAGGLCIISGKFEMSGGTISGNTITVTESTANSYAGGVYIYGRFEMSGGTISGNIIKNTNNSKNKYYAGGVYVKSIFTLSGNAKIINNSLLNGKVLNVLLSLNRKIDVGVLENGALFGVSLETGLGTFTSGYETNNPNLNIESFFISDNDNYIVNIVDGEGVIETNTLDRVSIETCVISDLDSFAWNPASDNLPNLVISDSNSDNILKFLQDYTVSPTDIITGHGEVTLNIKGIGKYKGSTTATYQLIERDITLALKDNNLSVDSQEYTGLEIKPGLGELKDYGYSSLNGSIGIVSGIALVENVDYKITYSNNIELGIATIIITGIGNYSGETTTTFDINKADLTNKATIKLTPSSKDYSGSAVTIDKIEVSINGIIVSSSNYIVTYLLGSQTINPSEMINKGTYTIRVTGTGNYQGSVQEYFVINAFDISNTTASIDKNAFKYNKESQIPNITLTHGESSLTIDEDYGIIYRKDSVSGVIVTSPIDAGTYYIILTGKGNYTGTNSSLSFTIDKADLTNDNVKATFDTNIDLSSFVFDNLEHKLTLTSLKINDVEFFDSELFLNVSYYRNNILSSDFKNAGTITIRIVSNNNNITGQKEFNYYINKKDLTYAEQNGNLTITGIVNKVYNRQVQTLDVGIIDNIANDYVLTSSDFSISYTTDCIEAGDVEINITANVSGNYMGSFKRTFKIEQATVNSFELLSNTGVYNAEPQSISANVKSNDIVLNANEYALAYSREDLINVGTIKVSVNVKSNNFKLGDVSEVEYIITPAQVASVSIVENNGDYNTQSHEIKISNVVSDNGIVLKFSNDISLTDYTFEYLDKNGIVTTEIINAGDYTIRVTGKGNFEGSATALFVINAKTLLASQINYYYIDSKGDFLINPDNNDRYLVNLSEDYKGSPVKPEVVVSWDEDISDYILIDSKDFSFGVYSLDDTSFSNNLFENNGNLDVNEYVFKIEGIGNFTGTLTKTYKVNLANFIPDNIKVDIKAPDKLFNGSAVTLEFTGENKEVDVYYKNNITGGLEEELISLKYGVDFELYNGYVEVVYDENIPGKIIDVIIVNGKTRANLDNVLKVTNGYVNNTAVGTATVVLIAKEGSNFTRDTLVAKQFNILEIEINNDNIDVSLYKTEYVYTGNNITPQLVVTLNYNNKELIYGQDYDIIFSANINVGSVDVTIEGINGYKGTVVLAKCFSIVAKEITDDMISISPNTIYNGKSQIPTISLSYNGKQMEEGNIYDYVLTSMRNNIVTTDYTSAGNITLSFEGKNNFKGTLAKTFVIAKQEISSIVLNKDIAIFNGYNQKPEIVVRDVLGNNIAEDEFNISYSKDDFINVGEVTISVLVDLSSNYTLNGKEVTKVFTITKAQLSETSSTIQDQEYEGFGLTPEFDLFLNSYKVLDGEYEVKYSNNINVGIASILLTAKNINFTGSKELTFNIIAKNILNDNIICQNFQDEFIYTGSSQKPNLILTHFAKTLVLDRDYTYIITGSEDESIGSDYTNVGDYVVKVSGIGNYIGEKNLKFSIIQRDISKCLVDIILIQMNLIFTGVPIEPPIQKVNITFNGIKLSLQPNKDYKVTYENTIEVGEASISIEGIGNFKGLVAKTYEILQRDLAEATLSEIGSKVYTGNLIVLEESDINLVYSYYDISGDETYNYKLTKNDYLIYYSSNPINVNSYVITLMGKGNFYGSIQTTFDVKPLNLEEITISFNNEMFSDGNKIVYTGSDLKQTIIDNIYVEINGIKIAYNTAYIIEFENNNDRYLIDVGIKNFVIKSNSSNVIGNPFSSSVEIIAKNLSDDMLEVITEEMVYNHGNPVNLEFNLSYNGIKINENEYEIIYTNNINANNNNSAILTIRAKTNGNFNGEIIYRFSIDKANPNIEVADINKNFFVGESINETNYKDILNAPDGDFIINNFDKLVSLSLGKNDIEYTFVPTTNLNYNSVSGVISVIAYYKVNIYFGDYSNVLAGSESKVDVSVKHEFKDVEVDVNKNCYKVIITLLDKNTEVNNLILGGKYQIKVELIDDNYRTESNNIITFYAKSKILYAKDAPFYAVGEDYFEEGCELKIDTLSTREEIINSIGLEVYNEIEGLVKVYKIVGIYKDGVPYQVNDVKIYYISSVNNFYTLNESGLVKLDYQSKDIEVTDANYFIIANRESNIITIIIVVVVVIILLIILLLIIKKILHNKKKKRIQESININKLNQSNNVTNINGSQSVQKGTEQVISPQQNLQQINNLNNQINQNNNINNNLNNNFKNDKKK